MLLLTQKELKSIIYIIRKWILSKECKTPDKTLVDIINETEKQNPDVRILFNRFISEEKIKII